jgi:2-polyprenyl-3-methyl-5-hydroxy-6-metoxy-1,4-benzoquinol methylase
MSPLANSYLTQEQLSSMEPFYPLHVYVCEQCLLVQLQEFSSPVEIFGAYAYFSSYSDSWLQHAQTYVDRMVDLLELNSKSQVVEIASNDGYLLQYFVTRSVPVLGIEPAANVAQQALKKGIPTYVRFFGEKTAFELADEGKRADLLIGNNVLAHATQLNDFVKGLKIMLKPRGI